MRAGILTEPIEITTAAITKNEYGEEAVTWTYKYSTRARIIHTSENRTIDNAEIVYPHVIKMEIRYYVPIDDFDRVVWRGTEYKVISILPDKPNNRQQVTIERVNE